MKIKITILIMTFGLVFVTNSTLAFGQQMSLNFQLNPSSLRIEGKIGRTQTEILTVKNITAKSVHYRIYKTGFEVSRDGKFLFEEATRKYSALDWIKIGETEFDIPADGGKEVKVKISVPANTKRGEYFAVIMVESREPTRTEKAMEEPGFLVPIVIRRGCMVKIAVRGRTIRKKAEILEIRVEMPGPERKEGEIGVIATLENKCQVHLDAEGEVKIKNLTGRIFDKFTLYGAGKDVRGKAFVYPEGMRDFWGMITRPLPPGEYIAETNFTYGYRFRKIRAKKSFIITEAVAERQKEFLVLKTKPEFFELNMVNDERRIKGLKITNLDFNPLEVEVFCNRWSKVEPSEFTIPAERSKYLRIVIMIPPGEESQRIGKIVFKPEKGKEVIVDIIVKSTK